MDYNTLLQAYKTLLKEHEALTLSHTKLLAEQAIQQNKYDALVKEYDRLLQQLAEHAKLSESMVVADHVAAYHAGTKIAGSGDEFGTEAASTNNIADSASQVGTKIADNIESTAHESINKHSSPEKKVALFQNLFQGRTDVYAARWKNQKGRSGYSPVCTNQWQKGLCQKPQIPCSKCANAAYEPLTDSVIKNHLAGNTVVGIYPLNKDETCHFLAMDFDGGEWKADVLTLWQVCNTHTIPVAVERSRSGNGAHCWFFFSEPVSAGLARRFGTTLLTHAMSQRHAISFASYDRLFPNQDTIPKGGFGNLIALPLQKGVRAEGHSEFVDTTFTPYPDQWEFLASIQKIDSHKLQAYMARLGSHTGLGFLQVYSDEDSAHTQSANKSNLSGATLGFGDAEKDSDKDNPPLKYAKPWAKHRKTIQLSVRDFPRNITVIQANMLYIEKHGISEAGLNFLKRLAAFSNPEFYRAQAMRFPTYDKPRIISLSEEIEGYLCLPRGCQEDIAKTLKEFGVNIEWVDKRYKKRPIDVTFRGTLRDQQADVTKAMLRHHNGVLSATTAFGKTVVGAYLIAERKQNTLILVHTRQLLEQWKERLGKFLVVHEELPEDSEESPTPQVLPSGELQPSPAPKKRGRKKKRHLIGQIGGGKNTASGIIDIALMQSVIRNHRVKDFIQEYGMVIVDECHHVPAFSFEQILKSVHATYVYGLTATPIRKDGHHPIIFLQCGPIRYTVSAKKQARIRPFDHFIIPRFTPFVLQAGKAEQARQDEYGKQLGQSEQAEQSETSEQAEPFEHTAQQTLPPATPAIASIYTELVRNEDRNLLIVDDIVHAIAQGRKPIVLTERTTHVDTLVQLLQDKVEHVITLTGKMSPKERREALEQLSQVPDNNSFVIVATGRFIGEGFDEPRLDTLFLAMPVAWKGTIAQYAGRLHRLAEDKSEVIVFDYVDTHVAVLDRMYQKRLQGYAAIGYSVLADMSGVTDQTGRIGVPGELGLSEPLVKSVLLPQAPPQSIFDYQDYRGVFEEDLASAKAEITVVSPYIAIRKVEYLAPILKKAVERGVLVHVITQSKSHYPEKEHQLYERKLDALAELGVKVSTIPELHQKFTTIDNRVVWYGNMGMLNFGGKRVSLMRLLSKRVACELLEGLCDAGSTR